MKPFFLIFKYMFEIKVKEEEEEKEEDLKLAHAAHLSRLCS